MIAPENDIYQDDWTQRLKENPSDPLEDIRQEHEGFLSELEGLAVEAIATHDWSAFYTHVVDFQNDFDLHGAALIAVEEASIPAEECLTVRHSPQAQAETSADELHTRSAGSLPTTELNQS